MRPIVIARIRVGMDEQQACVSDHADRVVTMLAIFETVVNDGNKRVVKIYSPIARLSLCLRLFSISFHEPNVTFIPQSLLF